jgi:hypothetical protein
VQVAEKQMVTDNVFHRSNKGADDGVIRTNESIHQVAFYKIYIRLLPSHVTNFFDRSQVDRARDLKQNAEEEDGPGQGQ